ncbi:TetR/AcrR family transcriptional regulator [Asaia bogorensis]|uniref:TetR/AcrR family transcriptional regulator n=1 Tax=Asaia bogorensis TaxID=91915 RepID=UPI000EFBE7AA|nr:TetR/AcrR family transcriptional regulator [Asaia bogorensis]
MSTSVNRQGRKRQATRQRISDIATALFATRGFDHVTIDAIAEAADVGRMTVFNHFARKEDLFFDREDEIRQIIRNALTGPLSGHPLDVLRQLAHEMVSKNAPFLRFAPQTQGFIDTLTASETLKSRARALRDIMTDDLREALSAALPCPPDDPSLHLAAALLVTGWTTAFIEAQRLYRRENDSRSAQNLFLSLVDTSTVSALYALRQIDTSPQTNQVSPRAGKTGAPD